MMHEHEGGAPQPDADRIAHLVQLAGRRPMPDPERMTLARTAAHEQWMRVAQQRRWRTARWTFAGALVAACAIAAVFWPRPRPLTVPATPATIATLRTSGDVAVMISGVDRAAAFQQSGAGIRAGDRLETAANGRAAFTLPDGISVRLDHGTRLVVYSASHLAIERGAVYVDTGATHSRAQLDVETSFGMVRHLGTQFEVRLDEGALQLRVREGSVALQTSTALVQATAGEVLSFAAGRAPDRGTISSTGPEWNWISTVAEPFVLEGATVPAFLHWASREAGWHWQFADPGLQTRAERIVLHGSIDGLTPDEALAAVLPTCGLSFQRDGDRLIVKGAGR